MRLITLLLVTCIVQASANSFAQKITLSQKNVPLVKVFDEIRNQSGYDFLFTTSTLKNAKLVSIDVKEAQLNDVLLQIFKDQPLEYSIEDKSVVVSKKEKRSANNPQSTFIPPITVRGKVTDEKGNILPGVSIRIKSGNAAVATDANGAFIITAPNETSVLVVSFIGYATQEIPVNGQANMVIVMKEEASALKEIVVVGYGTQKKANLTGAVSTVNVDEVLGNRPVSTTGSVLQGTIPGLNVNIGTGEPGAATNLNIRGGTDISAPGTTPAVIGTQGPFLLVDNVPFNGPLNLIDPNDIETVTVLKDAGSAAIYGARSAFGVILITTKKGKKNQQTRFNYSNNLTLAGAMNLPKKATVLQTIQSYKDMGTVGYFTGNDVDTWLALAKEYEQNPAAYPSGSATVNGVVYPLKETDAIKNVIGDHSKQFLHNLSVNGGSDKTTFRISAGTVRENGIIVPDSKQDNYKRYNIRSAVSSDIKSWFTAQFDASYYNSIKSYPANDGFGPAAVFAPYIPMDDFVVINGETVPNGTPRNVVALRAPTTNRLDDTRLTGRAILKPLAGLRLTGEYTFDNLRGLVTFYDKVITAADARTRQVETTGAGLFRKTNQITDYRALNIFANYDKSFGNHNISAVAGYNQEESINEVQRAERNGVISAEYPSISQATGLAVATDNYSDFGVQGVFGRINYDYKGKYLLGITGRQDASSKFRNYLI